MVKKGDAMTGKTNKSIERKQEILIVAQKLFNTKGFQETSINDIMKTVGAAKGVFYYYFETKDQVLDTLVELNINEIVDGMVQVVSNPDLNATLKLKYMLREEFRVSTSRNDLNNHLHNIKNVDMHQRIMVSMIEEIAPLFSQVVKQGILEGTFKTQYPLEVCEIVIAGVHFVSDLGIFHLSREQYIKRIKASEEIIEKALGVEEGGFNFLSEMLKETSDRIMDAKAQGALR